MGWLSRIISIIGSDQSSRTLPSMIKIGPFSKHTILTGAGWTKNWGGRLAWEVWEDLISHPKIQGSDRLRSLLLGESEFEKALALASEQPYDIADRKLLEEAVSDAFVAMDRDVADPQCRHLVDKHCAEKLLFRLSGQYGRRFPTSYLFTLNQDLWPERHLVSWHICNAIPLLPGVSGTPGQPFFQGAMGSYSSQFEMRPSENLDASSIINKFNVVKLHGSFNWRSSDGNATMVVGKAKADQIKASPLLKWYFDIFERVLFDGDVKLMIVGYGFGDDHVNEMIARGINEHGLKVFVWNTNPKIKECILASRSPDIWKGLIGASSKTFAEVFTRDSPETEAYKNICQAFFG